MSHIWSDAMAHCFTDLASSVGTATTAAMVRSVTASSSVFGNTRFTSASATQAFLSRRSRMPAASTRRSVVFAGTFAMAVMSSVVRCSTPLTVTFSTANRLELYATTAPMTSAATSEATTARRTTWRRYVLCARLARSARSRSPTRTEVRRCCGYPPEPAAG